MVKRQPHGLPVEADARSLMLIRAAKVLPFDEVGHAGNCEGDLPVFGGVGQSLGNEFAGELAHAGDFTPEPVGDLAGAEWPFTVFGHRVHVVAFAGSGMVPAGGEESGVLAGKKCIECYFPQGAAEFLDKVRVVPGRFDEAVKGG